MSILSHNKSREIKLSHTSSFTLSHTFCGNFKRKTNAMEIILPRVSSFLRVKKKNSPMNSSLDSALLKIHLKRSDERNTLLTAQRKKNVTKHYIDAR